MVYFIEKEGRFSPVKIGFSQDPEDRCRRIERALRTGPLAVSAIMPGGIGVEQLLHRRFAEGRIEGEWFDHKTPGLHGFIGAVRHFEGFWPYYDRESPMVQEVLAVLAEADYEVPLCGYWEGWA